MQSLELNTNLLNILLGFLTFDLFISPAILFLAYYLGALIFPLLIYRYVYRNFKNIPSLKLPEVEQVTGKFLDKFSPKLIFLLAFILFELFWRIFFEFIMAYFQIREYLMSMNIIG